MAQRQSRSGAAATSDSECARAPNRLELESASTFDFNRHFGAVPRPSDRYIQSPGNWSVARLSENVVDNDEFVRTCVFKWSFNVKPDIVLQTPSGQLLSIEAKWDSGEGSYPSSEREKKIFLQRKLNYVSQTEVQRYLVNDLLGFDGTLIFLARRGDLVTSLGRTVTWAETLQALDLDEAAEFIRRWSAQEIEVGRQFSHGGCRSGHDERTGASSPMSWLRATHTWRRRAPREA